MWLICVDDANEMFVVICAANTGTVVILVIVVVVVVIAVVVVSASISVIIAVVYTLNPIQKSNILFAIQFHGQFLNNLLVNQWIDVLAQLI